MSRIHDTRFRIIRCLGLITIVIFGIISTLGSGGGGGDGTSGPQPLTYSGNTEPAIITLDNAPTLVANVLYGGYSATDIPIAASTSTPTNRSAGAVVVTDYLRIVIQHSLERLSDGNLIDHDIVTGFTVNQPIYCDSGSANLSGQLNDSTGTGTLNFTYDNCMLDGVTYDGTGTFRVDVFEFSNLYPTDATMNFTLMTMSGPEFNGSISGTIRMETLFATNTLRMTVNYVAKDNITNKMYKSENFIVTSVYDNIYSPTTLSMQFTGSPAKAYDSIHGYVEVDTPIPLVYSSVDLPYPDSDGVMLFVGDGGASIRLTVLSGESVRLNLDIDGIPGYEITRTLLWTELALNSRTDINDTDNDGIHDNWETVNGLDPTDSIDASQDADGDGVSNLLEYLGGTDPMNASSFPPTADLSITVESRSAVPVGVRFYYDISITNNGPDAVDGYVVTDVLPSGFTASNLNCEGTPVTTCIFSNGVLDAGASMLIRLYVTASEETLLANNIATVESRTLDPDSNNNSDSTSIEIAAVGPSIQALIDAAADGDTIYIAPGWYVGHLNYLGKDIRIVSTDGASNTFIDGNESEIVQIGPLGEINGFTLTNSQVGAAIFVVGDGALIRSNIIEGNHADSFGSGIYANGVSPIIDGNIFRNNSCGYVSPVTYSDAVITAFSDTSILITNNIFEDNMCVGVYASSPLWGSVKVMNNTFTKNHTAIYVDQYYSETSDLIYKNNILVLNSTGFAAWEPLATYPTWQNNLVYNNNTNYSVVPDQTGSSGNISADPLFVDASNSDYHLLAGSPAIDAGSDVDAPTTDFDGLLRPADGDNNGTAITDIGAFEY